MANPLKVLTDLSASSGLAVSGSAGLKVQQGGLTVSSGTSTFAGTTISDLGTVTTVDINGGTIDGASIGASTQAAGKFTTISGSSTLDVAGAATLAGGVTVTGAAINASAVAVSASALNVSNNAAVGGNLTVTGDLQVQGSINAVNRTDLHVTDKVILVASGSANAAAANGAGLQVSIEGVSDPSFTYDQTGKWVSTENLDLASAKTFKINGNDVLSSDTLGSGVANSSLTSVGTLSSVTVGGVSTLSGAVLFKTDTDFGLGTGSYVNLSGTFAAFSEQLNNLQSAGNDSVLKSVYSGVRSYSYAGKGAGSSVQFLLSGSTYAGTGTAAVTASCPTKLSGSSSGDVLSALRYASFDVATKDQGATVWTNDLVSVQIAATQPGGSGLYFPVVTVDAPALASGAEIRLIVVNEATAEFM